MKDILSQVTNILDAKPLNEAKTSFDTLIKKPELLKLVRKTIGSNKLGSRDSRIELDNRPAVDLGDYITAVISLYREGDAFIEFSFSGTNMVSSAGDIVVMHALSHEFTLSELISAADAYAYRKTKFDVTVEKMNRRVKGLTPDVEDGYRITYTTNGFQKNSIDLYPSEIEKFVTELKKV